MRAESRELCKAAHLEAARKQRARQGTFSERPLTLLPFSKQAPAQTSPSAYQTLNTLKTQFLSLPQPTGSQRTLCLRGALSIQITPGGQRIKWTYSKPGADSKNGIQIKRKIREGVTYAASTWIAILSRPLFFVAVAALMQDCKIIRLQPLLLWSCVRGSFPEAPRPLCSEKGCNGPSYSGTSCFQDWTAPPFSSSLGHRCHHWTTQPLTWRKNISSCCLLSMCIFLQSSGRLTKEACCQKARFYSCKIF